jgi:hypothetical protein
LLFESWGGETMAFSFLKRGFTHLYSWVYGHQVPTETPSKSQFQERLVGRVDRIKLTAFAYNMRLPQYSDATWTWSSEVPRRQTIPRHVRMDMRPRAVLLCADCGAVVNPWSRHPCRTPGCGGKKRIHAVCNCIHLPLDKEGVKHHRIYLSKCEVHDQ